MRKRLKLLESTVALTGEELVKSRVSDDVTNKPAVPSATSIKKSSPINPLLTIVMDAMPPMMKLVSLQIKVLAPPLVSLSTI